MISLPSTQGTLVQVLLDFTVCQSWKQFYKPRLFIRVAAKTTPAVNLVAGRKPSTTVSV